MTARMPGEFGPHERTVICWPTRTELYPGERLDEARDAHAELARAIAAFEPVTMIAPPGAGDDATERCGGNVEVVEIPIDDSWFRDSGPIYVADDDGSRTAVDFAFNAWGEKFPPWDDDAAVARRWAEHAGHDVRSVDLVFEGGSISTDGEGSFVTTIQCLMHPNRNPSKTQREIEAVMAEALGAESVLWLPHGLALDDDTDGHVDNVAAFARPGVLVVQGCDDPAEPDHLLMDVNRRIADGWVDARGRTVEVVEVPVLPFRERDGERVPVPYLNYYVGNGFVAVPVCGHAADDDMIAIIAEQYPGRETFGLDIGEILALGGGGIHCITQQIPAV
ncbi:agmatine deiminase family protein [Ilumatobacter fluminis]|nr:agmatine deiminase family protein [Ilumatobacter fluminis]